MMEALFILYVANQDKSTSFYSHVLAMSPTLHVPGMTEFTLNNGSRLGLMPETGIKQLLTPNLPDPVPGSGIPRAELYLRVSLPHLYHQRSLQAGAKELSPMTQRDWGDRAAYSLDPDGHVLAFAETITDS